MSADFKCYSAISSSTSLFLTYTRVFGIAHSFYHVHFKEWCKVVSGLISKMVSYYLANFNLKTHLYYLVNVQVNYLDFSLNHTIAGWGNQPFCLCLGCGRYAWYALSQFVNFVPKSNSREVGSIEWGAKAENVPEIVTIGGMMKDKNPNEKDGKSVLRTGFREWQLTEFHTMHYMQDSKEKETKADQTCAG